MKNVDIVIPIYYNNVDEIEPSVKEQREFYKNYLKNYKWKIIIGINGLDKKGIVGKAKELSKKYENLEYDYTEDVGRGASLNKIFLKSKADFVCYMDVDLSTGLDALPRMLKELEEYEVVAGSKYIEGAFNKRDFMRYFLSKVFNDFFSKIILKAKFTDAQCGFKGMRREVVSKIMPLIQDKGWFWDTEMLYLVQRKNLSFKEVPVNWIEKGDSGVKIFKTVKDFIIKTIALRYRNL